MVKSTNILIQMRERERELKKDREGGETQGSEEKGRPIDNIIHKK